MKKKLLTVIIILLSVASIHCSTVSLASRTKTVSQPQTPSQSIKVDTTNLPIPIKAPTFVPGNEPHDNTYLITDPGYQQRKPGQVFSF